MFEFFNSTLRNNFALAGAVSELFSSQLRSVLSGSTVTANFGVNQQEIMANILPQSYILDTFRDYLEANLYLFDTDGTFNCFKMIMGQIDIIQTSFINQQYVIFSTGSRISLISCNFKDIQVESRILRISESDMLMKDTSMTNLTCASGSNEVFYFIKAYIEIQNLEYSSSTCQLMASGLSQVNLKELHVRSATLLDTLLIMLLNSLSVDFNNDGNEIQTSILDSSFSDISTSHSNLILVKNSEIVDIVNTSFTRIDTQVLKIEGSTVQNIEKVSFFDSKQCLYSLRSKVGILHDSKFEICGTTSTTYGGAIRLFDSDTRIHSSKFTLNKAKFGASLSVECNFGQTCYHNFTDLVFENNSASQMGGGIYYNLVRPFMHNISYKNNTAEYGADIASYAVRIVQRGTQSNKIYLDDVASGLEYGSILYFDLVDDDGQVMTLENLFTIKILVDDSKISVKGTDFDKFVNGQAQLDNLIFIGEAGLKNTTFKLTSRSINPRIISDILDNSDGKYDNFIDVSFRYCKPGEIETAAKQ